MSMSLDSCPISLDVYKPLNLHQQYQSDLLFRQLMSSLSSICKIFLIIDSISCSGGWIWTGDVHGGHREMRQATFDRL